MAWLQDHRHPERTEEMKDLLLTTLLIMGAPFLARSTPTNTTLTVNGELYEQIEWGAVTPATVTIHHRIGVATLPLASLPAEIQQQLGYDPQKAATYRVAIAKATSEQDAARTKAVSEREWKIWIEG